VSALGVVEETSLRVAPSGFEHFLRDAPQVIVAPPESDLPVELQELVRCHPGVQGRAEGRYG